MSRLFGKPKAKEPAPNLTECISNLDGRVTSIENKCSKIDEDLTKIKCQLNKMKEGAAKNSLKQKALRLLKQRKAYEGQVENLRNQTFNMEQANYANQSLKDTKVTMDALRIGVNEMKKGYKHVDIDKIDDLQDDMADLLDQASEVQDALGRTYGMPEVDDDELEAELNALGEELLDDKDSSYLDDAVKTPSVPTKDPSERISTSNSRAASSVPVDEFGLPQLK